MIKWLDRTFEKGIFEGPFKNMVVWCDRCLSFNNGFNKLVKARLSIPPEEKAPVWSSELYQMFSLIFGVVLLVAACSGYVWLSCLSAIVALYRPFEIMVFAIRWVFAPKGLLHSYPRSLAGFIINIMEVVVFFAAAYIGFGLMNGCSPILTAVYSSARITVTIGPFSTAEPPESLLAGALITAQIAISYFLTVVVVASIIGALKRREVAQPVVPPDRLHSR
jgi:hypothetical protein